MLFSYNYIYIFFTEEFETYCDKTANSPMWGGQIEVSFLTFFIENFVIDKHFMNRYNKQFIEKELFKI